jgi:ABC-type uncharacterized transport system involved in gliding motility auxiliary subunit
MKKHILSWTGLLLAILLFLAFNILSSAAFKSTRADLTENGLYTLSPGTEGLLEKLEEPIKLRLFFSKKLATEIGPLNTYAQRVQELLEQYVSRSKGRITLEVIDPEPYTDEEDQAVGYGLRGVTINTGGENLYFGLVGTNSTDQEEVVPFLQESKEDALEYDVTRMIYTLSHSKKRVVGLLTKLPMEGNPMARFTGQGEGSDPWYLVEAMRQMFEVKTIPPTAETIDADVDVLMIVHPQGLSPATQYAIDQYALRGGRVLAFVDPFCTTQPVPQDPSNPMAGMMANKSSDLGPLLGAWGLELSADDIAADRTSALRVGFGGAPVDYVVYLGLRGDRGCFATDDFVTSKLETVNLATAGVLRKKDGGTTTVTPLIQTTKDSMRVPRSSIQFSPDPSKLMESFVSGDAPLMIAARASGPAKTAFPDGKPKAETPEDGQPPPAPDAGLKEAQQINVVVVADCDLLHDNFWTQTQPIFGQKIAMPIANNADFVINALDNLSGSNDLISLRSRGRSTRPFEKVAEIRRAAETRYGQKVAGLESELKEAQDRIDALEGQKEGATSGLILSPEQQKEVERFREERNKTRKELRTIKHDRDKDIEALGTVLKFVNIFLIPILLILAAIGLSLVRWNRAKAAASTAGARS